MAVNILSKRVVGVADIPVKEADGTIMRDEKGNPVTATVDGPATKVWQVANARKRRRAMQRTREAGGKYELALENNEEDEIEFLCTVTRSFNNIDYGEMSEADKVRAIYSDPELGFIRDHMSEDVNKWENFMSKPSSGSNSGSDNIPG